MANHFKIYSATDTQIDFMQQYPETIANFIDGEPAQLKQGVMSRVLGKKPELPPGWPTIVPDPIDVEINHRNVTLYHLLLNGTADKVVGPGSLFQTWFSAEYSAIELDIQAGAYALKSDQTSQLYQLVCGVQLKDIPPRFAQWLKSEHQDAENPTADECNMLWRDMVNLKQGLELSVKVGAGIIWLEA